MNVQRKGRDKCSFRFGYNPDTLEPTGPACGEDAVEEIHWKDGRISNACPDHGLGALTEEAQLLVAKVTKL